MRAPPSSSLRVPIADPERLPAGGRLLILDDDEATCKGIEGALKHHDFDVTWYTSGADPIDLVTGQDFDVILAGLDMTSLNGVDLCKRILAIRPDVPIVVITGDATMEAAIAAIRVGAYDFITKPVGVKFLGLAVARAIQHRRLHDEVKRLRREVVETQRFGQLLGGSPSMKVVFDLIARLAGSDASVLITGESGTGKELIARAIHEKSARRDGPFLAINCAAMPPALLESELFGHVRGAFTDAKATRKGLFIEADGGTLFLDEIDELPIEMQPKLLRALQERKVRPIGSNAESAFDARIVTATNRDLEEEVDRKRFREDLYYRINVVRVDAPPLRERGGDVLLLAQHFVERFATRCGKQVRGITVGAAEKIVAYNWPGNVRELENCMERAVALLRFEEITVDDLPEKVQDYHPARLVVVADDPAEVVTLDELERRYIFRVLALFGGNKSRAADVLGMDRRTLYRRIERYERSA